MDHALAVRRSLQRLGHLGDQAGDLASVRSAPGGSPGRVDSADERTDQVKCAAVPARVVDRHDVRVAEHRGLRPSRRKRSTPPQDAALSDRGTFTAT